jgi:signal transduction histidine kinase/DNA-binding response OmpR family regulator/HPt (histidine-containing phosphotransfer) domain-containing protein
MIDRFSHAPIFLINVSFRLIVFVMMALLGNPPNTGYAWAGEAPLTIGVLAIRGPQQCLDSWSPTADYLTRQVAGRRFIILPLAHERIYASVQKGEVDFILANSALYVELEHGLGVNRIATLKERRLNGVYTQYGGVIFCRSDRIDIRALGDLPGKSFMAVSESSMGGWLMAWRELKEYGIDPYQDFKELRFGQTHDGVVVAVRDRLIDAGTVRTNTLEVLNAEGKIDLADYYVFPRLHDQEMRTPYLCTTREYPAWPMAKVSHTPDGLAEKVALALLQMPPDSPAARAAGCAGWTIPLNYQPVHDCLKALNVGPYKDIGKISFTDVLLTYGHWIVFAGAAFSILAAFTGVVLELNRKIKASHVRLKEEIDLHKQKDRELKQAKELAETATRAKSEFLANMSHEIRTPMNGVIAAADLALGQDVPPKIEHYLKIIHGSAYSLLGIINDILDFSKIEAGKFELKERIFRLNEVFDRVMELFVGKAAEKGIEILVDIDRDTPRVILGDPLRLQQILTNLISNAIKFTETGGVILLEVKELGQPREDAQADEVLLAFSVKDTGSGIAPEYRDLLFEPFSQADTSSTRKHEGTGLGLSICKQLVTMMGGDIGLESELGKGSTFFFTVRLRRPSAKTGARLVVPPDIQGLNALVVDDLADSRTIMRKMLESLGFRVEVLASGPEALRRLKDNSLRNNPVELIMMDWKMPAMDGIEVSKKIRQELRLTMPIIMMTAFGKETQRVEAEKAGINGFLTKPIYSSTLFDAIMDGFGKEGAKGAGRKKQFTTRASIYRKPLKGIRILVAEDNPTNQQVAQAILEGAEIAVTIVNNGAEAVQAIADQPFDAVLMDIQMPRMNGYEATRLIRELPRGASIPIVAMTAHAMKGDEEKCLEAGMDGYVSKPVDQDRLFHTLYRLLRTRDRSSGFIEPEEDEASVDPETDPGDVLKEDSRRLSGKPHENGRVLPVRLPGIEIAQTLAALDIDGPALRRILIGFRRENRETSRKIRQALSANDREQMLQLAHGLKGSAANIGAAELHRAAHALETACREGLSTERRSSGLEGLVVNLESALNLVLESIQSLEDPGAGDAAPSVSGATDLPFDALLAQLAEAIDRADPAKVTEIMLDVRQQAARCQHIDPSSLKTLEEQVNRYDYEQALATIRKIGNSWRGDP